jgi:hypothetical protein
MGTLTLQDYKDLIEQKLGIHDTLLVEHFRIIPNKTKLTKKFIKTNFLDDLFEYHLGKPVFKTRLLSIVAELTNRQLLTGHYHFEKREA